MKINVWNLKIHLNFSGTSSEPTTFMNLENQHLHFSRGKYMSFLRKVRQYMPLTMPLVFCNMADPPPFAPQVQFRKSFPMKALGDGGLQGWILPATIFGRLKSDYYRLLNLPSHFAWTPKHRVDLYYRDGIFWVENPPPKKYPDYFSGNFGAWWKICCQNLVPYNPMAQRFPHVSSTTCHLQINLSHFPPCEAHQ